VASAEGDFVVSTSGHTPRVVIASDKFKGSLTATEVRACARRRHAGCAAAASDRLASSCRRWDGTVAAALSAGYDKITVDAVGPTGEPVRAPYALHSDRAVVELAAVVGLSMLPGGRLDPLGSSTYGLGLLIADAIRRGATTVVLGLGGSASTDGGAGWYKPWEPGCSTPTATTFNRAEERWPILPSLT
jgi:glycerate kinase